MINKTWSATILGLGDKLMSNPALPAVSFPFTDEQKVILRHVPSQHGRLLAGPGTGKSTTAVALAQELASRDPIPRIKFLTFTRAATAELSKKLSAKEIKIELASTIHSFSISALMRNTGSATYPTPLRIPDRYEWKNLIRQHLARKTGVGVRQLGKLVNEMSAKWESLVENQHEEVSPEVRARFMGAWGQHRNIFGYTLLDELPDLFRQALNNYDDLVGLDYDILIVDEYQDLNACDLEILRRLANRGISIFAIGDDDQSIYSFRKAHPIGIQNFLQEYNVDESCDYDLTICQRSPRLIFNWAQHVILGLPDRDRGRPNISFSEKALDGTCALLRFNEENHESNAIADIINWLHRHEGISPSEILVLYRTETIGGPVATRIRELLAERGIPTSNPKLIDDLLASPENRWLLSILHLLVNPTDSLAWWSLIRLAQGIGDSFIDAIYELAVRSNTTFGQTLASEAEILFSNCPAASRKKALAFWQEINGSLGSVQLQNEAPENWGIWIESEIRNGRLPVCTPEFLDLLINIGNDNDDEYLELDRFLSQIEPKGRDLHQSKSDGVRFMSMMGSKGLTVKATIVIGVDNDIVPLPRGDQGEERRLLYVAMTRSTGYLFMTWVTRRAGQGSYAGRENFGRRQYSEFLRGGPVESQDGLLYVRALLAN